MAFLPIWPLCPQEIENTKGLAPKMLKFQAWLPVYFRDTNFRRAEVMFVRLLEC